MRSSVELKEEPAVSLPESSSTDGPEAPQSLKKGPWSAVEDAILMEYVKKHGEGNWNAVRKKTGLQRYGKSCRLRWANHLRPNLKKGSFSREEENLIIQLHAQLGNKWARMATQLCGRTDNEIKNFWNTRVKRRQRAGLPPYPPEIQRQVTCRNKRQGTPMFNQNQVRSKNYISYNCPTMTTLFNNASFGNDEMNYLQENFNLSLPYQQVQSHMFPIIMEQPSTQWYPSCIGDQNVTSQSTPPVNGQGSNSLFDKILRESQGPRELCNEGLLFEHSSTNGTALVEPLSSPIPPPPSNTEHSAVDPHYKLSNSNISIGPPAMKQSAETMKNQNVSNLLKTNTVHATTMPTVKWCDSSSVMNEDNLGLEMPQQASNFSVANDTSVINEDNLGIEMPQLASNFSIANDWNFEVISWENMPNIC